MQTQKMLYQDAGKDFEGHAVHDPTVTGKRPAVMVFHAWAGQTDFERDTALELAKLGYVGFAVDLFGKGVVGTSVEENTRLMQPFMDDRALLRRRALANLDLVKSHELVDTSRIAAMGYCFGGLCVLDLARAGAPVTGVVSVHGMFGQPGLADNPEKFSSKVLALHGHEDPFVPPEAVAGFTKEMTAAGADWQIHIYGHTMHAFTNPEINAPDLGAMYNPTSARRAWIATKNFFAEIFGA